MKVKGIKKERKDHVIAKKTKHNLDPPRLIAEEGKGER